MAIIKYAIADDHKIFRQGLKYALADDHMLKLIGEANNGQELLLLIEKQKTDVVLLDLKMPLMDGITTTKNIKSSFPGIKILLLTTYDDEQFIIHLMEIGANGYLLKNAEPEEIKKAIHSAYENDFYFNDLVSNTMLKNIIHRTKLSSQNIKLVTLSEKEKDVLRLICQENTTAEIAAKIFLSPRTVEGIRQALIEKIGVKNTAGLVVFAVKNEIYVK